MSAAVKLEAVRLTDADFEWVRRRIKAASGIDLHEGKRELVQGRMSRRLRALGLTDFRSYRELLDGPGGQAELVEFTNVLTTNVTAFFREAHHFDRLSREVVPALAARGLRRIRVWSAGCSSGEEPYTIGMTLLEALGASADQWDLKILATDLDTSMVEQGASGVYRVDRVDGMPRERLERWFLKGKGRRSGLVRVRPQLARMMRFKQLNLMETWPFKGSFDVIFCRNVMIYFDRPTRERLLRRFAERLAPGGWLFIGHSESVEDALDVLEPAGQTSYRKRGGDG